MNSFDQNNNSSDRNSKQHISFGYGNRMLSILLNSPPLADTVQINLTSGDSGKKGNPFPVLQYITPLLTMAVNKNMPTFLRRNL